MSIEQAAQVNENPTPRYFSDLLPIMREFGHAINRLILAPDIVATASLPAAGVANDGLVLIEWTGSVANLIVYSNGIRTRFGGAAF